jgi:preprotein translocase subunit SecY
MAASRTSLPFRNSGKRVLFTFGLLAVYRLGGHVPTPGINTDALALLAEQAASSNLFGL